MSIPSEKDWENLPHIPEMEWDKDWWDQFDDDWDEDWPELESEES